MIILLVILALVDVVKNDKEKAAKWLLLACTQAEKEFGSKTGALKLRYVYEMFIANFPLLSKFVSFDEFSTMVDRALEEMKHLKDTNMAIFEYIGGYEVEKLSKEGK